MNKYVHRRSHIGGIACEYFFNSIADFNKQQLLVSPGREETAKNKNHESVPVFFYTSLPLKATACCLQNK